MSISILSMNLSRFIESFFIDFQNYTNIQKRVAIWKTFFSNTIFYLFGGHTDKFAVLYLYVRWSPSYLFLSFFGDIDIGAKSL